MNRSASAPGKLMLAGEYAVLEGSRAVVAAVDRRVHARLAPAATLLSPVLRALQAELTLAGAAEAALLVEHVVADSSALCAEDGTKLGLGSSAAVCVAAATLALGGGTAEDLAAIAHRAHRRAQGGRGSGADIAASAHGGVVSVQPGADPEGAPAVERLALPARLRLVPVWTGRAAHTPSLVGHIQAWRDHDPGGHADAMTALADAADALIDALRAGDAERAVAALAEGGEAVAALGRLARVDLETDAHRRIRALAERFGGTAKPTGAGAGDLALAAFADPGAAAAFSAAATAAGSTPLPLAIDPVGARLEA